VAVGDPCKRLPTEKCGEQRVRQRSALTPVEAASPLARRPYGLWHACASLMLNAGVPATEAARRLGHSVAMLLKRYANCIDGQERAANDRIERALEDGGV
jgi:integrase